MCVEYKNMILNGTVTKLSWDVQVRGNYMALILEEKIFENRRSY